MPPMAALNFPLELCRNSGLSAIGANGQGEESLRYFFAGIGGFAQLFLAFLPRLSNVCFSLRLTLKALSEG
jgi:hypothetical protein